jgi:uncharacterized ParB-like nuclease family protein
MTVRKISLSFIVSNRQCAGLLSTMAANTAAAYSSLETGRMVVGSEAVSNVKTSKEGLWIVGGGIHRNSSCDAHSGDTDPGDSSRCDRALNQLTCLSGSRVRILPPL